MSESPLRSLADWVEAGIPGLLSVVIPAHNEEGNLIETVPALVAALEAAGIDYEIVVVNDNSTDGTVAELRGLEARFPKLRHVDNTPPNGFGFAVRRGLAEFKGEAVAIVMADLSDSPDDLVRYWHKLNEGYDCVFGSRFIKGGKVVDYPPHKLALNRLANTFIRVLFGLGLNDTTNAFKCFRRDVIAGVQPFLAHHFNLTVELPLKAIIRGYSYAVVPISWHNRKTGVSKLKIREMGSRYLFIVLYCLIEKLLSRGDYLRKAGR
ncbi:Glycosyltransferase [Paramagnetospirillum magnetotacticum MS-1]|uniref:Glycosyltransferase n=1 Tax=Paramagnetospirillum magnetotacticum MS-1 TaxID=272627 RepID=A0A0C2YRQ0_PARME|nr:glycosyltransferase family 2 protein [Paramagnetospirillum magnetotacticum]KIL97808.1 Glycosyltransferase [Paramagnetospirillum magnetotacticum MS-1]